MQVSKGGLEQAPSFSAMNKDNLTQIQQTKESRGKEKDREKQALISVCIETYMQEFIFII